VDNTRDNARVSHSRQWSNYNVTSSRNMDEIKHSAANWNG